MFATCLALSFVLLHVEDPICIHRLPINCNAYTLKEHFDDLHFAV